MELRDLRTFAAAVELGTMTRAAAQLHTVQPAVSQAIKRLERTVGVTLLERGPAGVAPTEAGLALHRHARLIMSSVTRAEDDMAAYRGLRAGTVRLGMPHMAPPLLLTALLRRIGATHPGLRLHVEEAMVPLIEERLELGQLDLAVVFFPNEFAELGSRRMGSVPLVAALGPGHPLAGRARLRLRELAGEAWVSFPPGNPARRWLDDACARAGFRPRIEVEVETFAQLKSFVEAGSGVAMLPAAAAEPELRAGLLRLAALVGPAPRMTLGYAFDRREPSGAVLAVRGLLEEVLRAATTPETSPARRSKG